MRGLRRLSRPPRLFGRLAFALVLVMLGLAYGRRTETAGRRLVSALLADRFTSGRLSAQTAWHPCVPADTAALVPRMECGLPLDPRSRRTRRINDLARTTHQGARPDSSPAALRRGALLDLRFSNATTAALERAVGALEQAVRLAPDDAGLLNELSVAQLALGEQTQQLTPMLRALEAIERAAATDSQRVEILFNRALIQQRLYLVASADSAWTRYLAVERDPRWRAEAQAHARWVAQVSDTVVWDTTMLVQPGKPTLAGKLQTQVARSPQAARDFAFEVLRGWAIAVTGGDSVRASYLLDLAADIGRAAERQGMDNSIALAVHAIRASSLDARTRAALADAHVRYAAGRELYAAAAYDAAGRTLAEAEARFRAAGSPVARWAAYQRATAEINRGNYEAADRILNEVLAEATPAETALIGKTVWALGVSQLRRGSHQSANRLYARARSYLVQAKEPDNVGTISYLLAEGLNLTGQSVLGRREAFLGLRDLSPFPNSIFLANHLAIVGEYARNDGLPHATLALVNEMVGVARLTDRPQFNAWAFMDRARDLIALDRTALARQDLAEALAWADSIEAGRGRERVRADVRLVLGQLTRKTDPLAAHAVLSDVVREYRRLKVQLYLPLALYEAALAASAAADTFAAHAHLDEAIREIERQQSSFESDEVRATLYETVENVFDLMIEMELGRGRAASALAYLERGRVALPVPHGRAAPRLPPGADSTLLHLPRRLAPGQLFVDYALLQNRMVIWTASAQGWRTYSVPVPRDSVAVLVSRFLAQTREAHAAGTPASGALFDLLVRPFARELRGVQQLVVVPDRELIQVPFAALREHGSRRFLIEDRAVRTVPSAAFFARAIRSVETGRPARPRSVPLVVGNPTPDTAVLHALPPLPGAANEAARVARSYPKAHLLMDADARRGPVLRALPASSLFHFAGHAVFNSEQPELSYLALAPERAGESGFLYAWEIGGLRLSDTDVVILSACSTLGRRSSRTGIAGGLAYSFLRAGAGATISTLWDVADSETVELLVEFHRRVARGENAADALRHSQLAALRSPRPELRSPHVWAAFVYTGR